MKFKITEKNNTVTLNVKLTKDEIKSENNVNYGWRSAKEKLEKEGYSLGKMLEYTTLMNKFAVYEGDFVFSLNPKSNLEETITSEMKVITSPPETKTLEVDKLDEPENVPIIKEKEKSFSPNVNKKSSGRSSRRKK